MRILSTFNSGSLKITVFTHETKYSLQVEDGECTQIFRFSHDQAPFLQNQESAAITFDQQRSVIMEILDKMRELKRNWIVSNLDNSTESFMEII
jgi:hypothetical protein